jgi:hypothetical protein
MVQLIANPRAFDGQRVQVYGYMNLEFEGNALYLHAEDFRQRLSSNSIWLEVPAGWPQSQAHCPSRGYVLLEGRFNANNGGHLGLWGGSLEEVTRCVLLGRTA